MKLPIRARLALVYCAVFFVLIAVLEGATYFSVRAAVHSIVDRELETRLAGIDDHLTRHIDKMPWAQLHDSLTEHPAFQPDLFFFQRIGGDVLFSGRSISGIPDSGYAETPRIETVDGTGRVLRILRVRRTIQGLSYNLALGTDLLMPTAVLRQLWLVMLISLPSVLLIASAAGYWIAGRALAPVSGIISEAQSIDSRRLSQRIAVPDTGDEIRLLAETINGMLLRIEDGVRQIRQFTANASHELRTPAAIIRASAEVALLQSPGTERSYKEALHRIFRESERNSTLIENLLQLARSDSGADRADHEPVDLARSVSRACAQIAPLAEAKQLQVHVARGPAEPRRIYAGEDHLRRLWLILLENAVKYTPPGGSISVSTKYTADGQPQCTVSDTGVGISPEHLPRLFERFYRVDKPRSRADGGTGLGLAIARELASLYDAVIDVQSEPSRGTSFSVTFPLHLRVSTTSTEHAANAASGR